MLKRFTHTMRVYGKLQLLHLAVSLEYEADFWIGIVGAVLRHTVGFFFIWVLFQRIPQIMNWTLWELVSLYALSIIPIGLVEIFYDGQWRLPLLLNQGEFDRLLVRPVSPALQVITQLSSIHGLGSVLLGIILLAQAAHQLHLIWGIGHFVFLIATLFSSFLIIGSINFISNCTSFWDAADSSSLAVLAQNTIEFAKYPLDLYSRSVRLILTWMMPFAFISYYPGLILLGKTEVYRWIGYGAPLVGPGMVLITWIVWHRSLRNYQGVGH
jgi:ABC-2 type transport system permease protein